MSWYFRNTPGWKNFTGTYKIIDASWSSNATYNVFTVAVFVNDTGKDQKISSFSMKAAVGSARAYFYQGEEANGTGTGNPINVTCTVEGDVSGNGTTSNTVTVSHQTPATSGYGNKSYAGDYSWSFSDAVVPTNGKVAIRVNLDSTGGVFCHWHGDGIASGVTVPATVYHTVHIYPNNGESVVTLSIEHGHSVDSSYFNRSYPGYVFKKWTDETGSDFNITSSITSDKVISGNWEQIQYRLVYKNTDGSVRNTDILTYANSPLTIRTGLSKSITITYNSNGSSDFPAYFNNDVSDTQEIVTKSLPWAGWSGSTGIYQSGDSYGFDKGRGDELNPTFSYVYRGDTPIPKRPHYIFEGWYKDQACTQLARFDDHITGNITLYANWVTSKIKIMTDDGWQPWLPSDVTVDNINKVHKRTSDGRWVKNGKVKKYNGTSWVDI